MILVDQIHCADDGVINWSKKEKKPYFATFPLPPRNETLTENRGHKLWWTELSFSFMESHGVSASRCQ